MNEKVSDGAKRVYGLLQKSTDLHIELWKEYVVFTWQWWFVMGLTLIPWIIWWKYRKKDSTHRLLFAGFFTIFISLWLDNLGARLGWWYYHYEAVPLSPSFKPWDISLLPVTTMFFMQIKPKMNYFGKAFLYAFVISFVAEPLFKMLGFYEYPNWEYSYSFFIYFVIYLIANFIATRNDFERL